jgi:hypothetical protein
MDGLSMEIPMLTIILLIESIRILFLEINYVNPLFAPRIMRNRKIKISLSMKYPTDININLILDK